MGISAMMEELESEVALSKDLDVDSSFAEGGIVEGRRRERKKERKRES